MHPSYFETDTQLKIKNIHAFLFENNLLWFNIIVLHSFNLFADFIPWYWLISCKFCPKAINILIQILSTIDNRWVNWGCLQVFTTKYTDRWRQKFLYVIISLDWRERAVFPRTLRRS